MLTWKRSALGQLDVWFVRFRGRDCACYFSVEVVNDNYNCLRGITLNMEEQQPSEYVTLVSAEGQEFVVRRSAAMISGTIKRMIDPMSRPRNFLLTDARRLIKMAGGFREATSNRCEFPDIKYCLCYLT